MILDRPEFLHLFWIVAGLSLYRLLSARRTIVHVGTLQIWRQVAAEVSPRVKIRPRIPLEWFFETALLSSIVLVCCGPRTGSEILPSVVILRSSTPSMMTEGRVRRGEDLLESIVRHHGVSRELLDVVDIFPTREGSVDWLSSVGRYRRPGRALWIVSDRVPRAGELPSDVGIRIVESPLENIGISAVQARVVDGGVEVFVGIIGTGPGLGVVPVQVKVLPGGSVETRTIPVPDREQSSVVFMLTSEDVEEVYVSLDCGGANEITLDDEIQLRRAVGRQVAAVEPGFEEFEDALTAAGYHVVTTSPDEIHRDASVWIGTRRQQGDQASILLPPAVDSGLTLDEIRDGTGLTLSSSVWRDIPLSGVVPGPYQSIVGGGQVVRPLLKIGDAGVVVHAPDQNTVVFGFLPMAWNWQESPSFPVVVQEVLNTLDIEPVERDRFIPTRSLDPDGSAGFSTPMAGRDAQEVTWQGESSSLRVVVAMASLGLLAVLVGLRYRTFKM